MTLFQLEQKDHQHIYGGSVCVTLDENHVYRVQDGGDRCADENSPVVPSVTQVLKATVNKSFVFVPWAAGLAAGHMLREYRDTGHIHVGDLVRAKQRWAEIRDEKGERGSKLHEALELSVDCLGDARGDALLGVARASEPLFVHPGSMFSERIVYSRKQQVAGTVDLYNLGDGGPAAILDLKTSPKIYVDHNLQLAQYSGMLDEEFGPAQEWHEWILHALGADVARAKMVAIHDRRETGAAPPLEFDREAFAGALTLYRRLKWKRAGK